MRPKPVGEPLTMSSLEIADLVGVRHDNVKRTIDSLVKAGAIEFPQIEEIPTKTKTATAYAIGKRDSYVVVAQLSPVFTAKLVDRWQELEAQLAQPVTLPAPKSKPGPKPATTRLTLRRGDVEVTLSTSSQEALAGVIRAALRP